MSHAVHFTNPFDLSEHTLIPTRPGQTIEAWLDEQALWAVLHSTPTVVVCDGQELTASQYGQTLSAQTHLVLVSLPQGLAPLTVLLISLAATTAVALLLPGMVEPDLHEGGDGRSNNHTLSLRQNRARLGQPKPVLYGRMRVYPDLSANAFSVYASDDQVVYLLFEVTQGACTVDEASLRFEDTAFSAFDNARYEIVPPGRRSRLFPRAVVTSSEVSKIELETTHGPFAVNEPATEVTQVSFDLVAPGGIYRQRSSGKANRISESFTAQVRPIDAAGVATGAYQTLGVVTLSSHGPTLRDAIRRTVTYDVTPGRYEARMVRITPKSTSTKIIDVVQWTALRGYVADALPVTDSTRVAVKIRSSEQLGNRALTKFNLVAERHLPVWDGQAWSDPVATRNVAWAFADACRNTTYGGGRDDAHIDLAGLLTLAGERLNCDGIFDSKTDLWSALRRIAQTAIGSPVDQEGVYRLMTDRAQSTAVQLFNMRNIVKDSFAIDYAGVLEETADHVVAEYYDEAQDYRKTEVTCALPGGTTRTPRRVPLWGVTDNTRAWEIGLTLAAMNRYRRRTVTFETGAEGRIPRLGERVRVAHYQLGVDQGSTIVSGDVLSYDAPSRTLDLAEPVQSSGFSDPFIVLHDLDGRPLAAYRCQVAGPRRVVINDPQFTPGTDDTGLVFEADYAAPRFQLGEGAEFDALVKITDIEPRESRVRIRGFIDAPAVYTIINGKRPPASPQLDALKDLLPRVYALTAFGEGTQTEPEVTLTWRGVNADRYQVEYLTSGASWQLADIVSSPYFIDAPQTPGVIRYRVAGISVFRGPWRSITIDTHTLVPLEVPPAPTGLVAEAFYGGVSIDITVPDLGTHGTPTHAVIWRGIDTFSSSQAVARVPLSYDPSTATYTAQWIDTGVDQGGSYAYFVRARNENGPSARYPGGSNPGVPVSIPRVADLVVPDKPLSVFEWSTYDGNTYYPSDANAGVTVHFLSDNTRIASVAVAVVRTNHTVAISAFGAPTGEATSLTIEHNNTIRAEALITHEASGARAEVVGLTASLSALPGGNPGK